MFAREDEEILVPLVAPALDEYHQPLVFLNVTLVRLSQYLNASEPILVTPLPIVTLVRLSQS